MDLKLKTTFGNSANPRALRPGLIDHFTEADGLLEFTEDGKDWELHTELVGAPLWVRASGAAQLVTPSPNAYAVADGRAPDGVYTVIIRTKSTSAASIVFRYVDARNQLFLQLNGGTGYKLRKTVGNVASTLLNTTHLPADLDVVDVTLAGSSVGVAVNGTALVGSPVTCTDFATATKYGLFNLSSDYAAAFESIEFVAA